MTMTHIYILAGQSNMAGAGRTAELPEPLRSCPPNVRLFEDGQPRALLWREKFGPEVGFSDELAAALPSEPTILLKLAQGGANLAYDWNPDGVSQSPEDTYRGPLYPRLLESLSLLAAHLKQQAEEPRVAGMLWMQGERDAVFDFMAAAYEANLRRFIGRVRSDTGEPDLPFIIAQICPRMIDLQAGRFVHAHRRRVQVAQAAVARNDPHAAYVSTDDLPQSDNLHFNTAGQIELGRRLARAYVTIASLRHP
jgi:lysophospholipase L1-like esterase